jgi:diaminohydroxyphosphoribosylaminopyrimidine deaminase/5-amino-6-(5-phosphoribosylamino)uracil reductase
MEDPFPEVSGKSLKRLRESGVQVEVGVCLDQARALNRFFCSVHKRGRPWVILKMAMSLDGRIATRTGDSHWISCERCRAIVHDLRAEVDAVLIGSGTALHDRPRLTARPEGLSAHGFSQPRRIVLDTRGRLLSQPEVIQDLHIAPLEILVGPNAERATKMTQESALKVSEIPVEGGHVQPGAVLAHLAEEDVLSVMIEGGQQVATAFLEARLVDELMLFVAPILIGGTDSPLLCAGRGVDRVTDALRLKEMDVQQIEGDILIRGRLSDWP